MEIPYTGKMAFIIWDGPGSHKWTLVPEAFILGRDK